MMPARSPEGTPSPAGEGAQRPWRAGERVAAGLPAHARQLAARAANPVGGAAIESPQHAPVLARTTAQLLGACAGAAGSMGLLCAAGALMALLARVPETVALLPCALVLLLLPLERLLWLRVRFDAGLFADLAANLAADLACEPRHASPAEPHAANAASESNGANGTNGSNGTKGTNGTNAANAANAATVASEAVATHAGNAAATVKATHAAHAVHAAHAAGKAAAAPPALTALDAALHALRLRGPAAAPRPLIDRALGARRLALRHALVALAQFALLVSALAAGRFL